MRIISQDGQINTSYENSFLCVVEDPDAKEWYISVRTPSLASHMPLATYKTKEEAMKEFKNLEITAQTSLQNSTYQFK